MRERLFLYLTDDEAVFYKDDWVQLFKGTWDEALTYLNKLYNISLRLFIDRSHQDIREEKLPPLPFWDLIRLRYHKRTQGGYVGIHIIKEGNLKYLQWVHIPKDDRVSPFMLKATSGVFFVPLEAHHFLKDNTPYQVLVYPLPNGKARQVVFKGRRMLLSRIGNEGEDIKTSLYFLSRHHPDILEMFHVKHLESVEPLLRFITLRRQPTLPLRIKPPFYFWARMSFGGIYIVCLGFIIFEGYQGLDFKNRQLDLNASVSVLEAKIKKMKPITDIASLRRALDHYTHIKSQSSDPLKTIYDLGTMLENHHVRLINMKWQKGKELDLTLTFLKEEAASDQFETLVHAFTKTMVGSRIQIIEAPFNSSPHEVFKGKGTNTPTSHIRILLP